VFARHLLQNRYGIKPEKFDDQGDWNVLYDALGTLSLTDVRGNIMMIVSEATGWCGIAATRFAPTLRNRYYVYFSMFLIATGLLHDWYVARGLNNPRILGFLKIRALMR